MKANTKTLLLGGGYPIENFLLETLSPTPVYQQWTDSMNGKWLLPLKDRLDSVFGSPEKTNLVILNEFSTNSELYDLQLGAVRSLLRLLPNARFICLVTCPRFLGQPQAYRKSKAVLSEYPYSDEADNRVSVIHCWNINGGNESWSSIPSIINWMYAFDTVKRVDL